MTDSKALIERLRGNFDLTECEHGFRLYGGHTCPNEDCDRRDIREAADHIEKLEADNARLREALGKIVALEDDFESNAAMTAHEWQMFHTARAALQETSHDD